MHSGKTEASEQLFVMCVIELFNALELNNNFALNCRYLTFQSHFLSLADFPFACFASLREYQECNTDDRKGAGGIIF